MVNGTFSLSWLWLADPFIELMGKSIVKFQRKKQVLQSGRIYHCSQSEKLLRYRCRDGDRIELGHRGPWVKVTNGIWTRVEVVWREWKLNIKKNWVHITHSFICLDKRLNFILWQWDIIDNFWNWNKWSETSFRKISIRGLIFF